MITGKGRTFVLAVTLLSAAALLVGGLWALTAPESFARFAHFPPHEHFEHDLGAFQLGAAVTLMLALVWSDALATALAGFAVLNTLHAVNHFTDLELGGSGWQPWGLALLSVGVVVALSVRIRQLGLVLGEVTGATVPALAPFVRQKTILLTTFRRDGTPVGTPVSIAVDGDHAYIRSFEKAFKTRRALANPEVEFTPSDSRGRPTGHRWHGRLDQVAGEEYRRAARLLARKYPLLHGVLVPLLHRAMRSRTGRTVHFRLTPASPAAAPAASR